MMRDANPRTTDFVGIGMGPFNLGLAALAQTVPRLTWRLVDRKASFSWHPGMLLDDTYLQVPFLADLVSVADPCNPLSYLAYLKERGRLYQFAIRDNPFL